MSTYLRNGRLGLCVLAVSSLILVGCNTSEQDSDSKISNATAAAGKTDAADTSDTESESSSSSQSESSSKAADSSETESESSSANAQESESDSKKDGKDTDGKDADASRSEKSDKSEKSEKNKSSDSSSNKTSSADGSRKDAAAAVSFTDAFVKATGDNAEMTAVFGTLVNNTGKPVTITGFKANVDAAAFEIHEVVDGKMRQKNGGITIPSGGSYKLEPGSDHFMLLGLKKPIKAGEKVKITVTVKDGKTIEFKDVKVRTIASGDEDYDGKHSGH